MTIFKNPKLPNLFIEFADCDELEFGDSIGDMTHEGACKHRIPTNEELHYLIACGALQQGEEDCWSSSVNSYNRFYAWGFGGVNGFVDNSVRDNTFGVRCVGRPRAGSKIKTAPAVSEAKPDRMDRVIELLERIVNNIEVKHERP